MFEGVFTALVTPFRDGEVDESAFRNLIDHRQLGQAGAATRSQVRVAHPVAVVYLALVARANLERTFGASDNS